MALQFNYQQCYTDFIALLGEKFKEVGTQIKDNMKKEVSKSESKEAWNQQVYDAIDFVLVKDAMTIGIECGMINSQEDFNLMAKAFISNYGMGPEMDQDKNSWLDEWLSSAYYNQRRPSDQTVLSRPGEEYFDPDVGMVQSNAKTEYPIKGFSQLPSYWFDNAVLKYIKQTTLDDVVSRTYTEFDFSKYLVEV